ncbi:sugar ABC transporter permease [Brachybacterium huguangmaarense]|uniref:Sugar ABC transporter permease n=1 Tax=Brachybacterium huguangmaarense TaxID=1652028 RepID=A0ABY6G1N6_9MICO|nr:sugar ABC transporter permease [Brachybacterium huguangmaarense]UYG17121.1 sugar ABC transporter permease [Brachybacterium huguangmaarense]
MAIGFLAVVAAPFVANVYISAFSWRGGRAPMRWAGLDNYARLLSDELFWKSFQNSLFMILGMVIVPTIIGLFLSAFLFDYIGKKFGARAASFLRATFYLPQILPIAVAGVVWAWILDANTGALNSVLSTVGIENTPDWLGDPSIAIYSIVLVLIWIQIGYPVVIFMAALQRVDPELYEAAEIDGAGWFRRFRAITIPQIRPEVFVVVLTATVAALKVFGPVWILTSGGPENSTYVPSYYSYRNFFEVSKVGYGAAIATVMSVVILIVTVFMMWWQRRSARRSGGVA